MRHKITVICDHGSDGAGVAVALLAAVVLVGSGAGAALAHAVVVFVIAAVVGIVVLVLAAVPVIVLVRRRRARNIAAGALAAPWRPVVTQRLAPWALPPARSAVRRAAIEAPRKPGRTVIPGRVDADPVPAPRGERHARPPA
jgi:hypothetical protein